MAFDVFGGFCVISCYFEYRIRIRCLFLYMGTSYKNMFLIFSTFLKRSRSVNTFRTFFLHKCIYTGISPSCPVVSRRRRPPPLSVRPSRRRRPSSVRPSTSVRRRRRPSSARPDKILQVIVSMKIRSV